MRVVTTKRGSCCLRSLSASPKGIKTLEGLNPSRNFLGIAYQGGNYQKGMVLLERLQSEITNTANI
jgi:hypothetical protein